MYMAWTATRGMHFSNKNNDKGARKIIKMIKTHDKDDNNDGMGWVVFGGVGGVVGRGQMQFLVGWRWRKKSGGVEGWRGGGGQVREGKGGGGRGGGEGAGGRVGGRGGGRSEEGAGWGEEGRRQEGEGCGAGWGGQRQEGEGKKSGISII